MEGEIIPIKGTETEIINLAQQYYQELTKKRFEVLLDDRDESAGRKFNDADLIGIPLRIILGKRVMGEGTVEIKNRETGEMMVVTLEDLLQKVLDLTSAEIPV